MNDHEQTDRLLAALGQLPVEDVDPAQSKAVFARATRVMARRRRVAERWASWLAAPYARVIEPVGAGVLAAAFLAAVVAQAIVVLRQAGGGFLWR